METGSVTDRGSVLTAVQPGEKGNEEKRPVDTERIAVQIPESETGCGHVHDRAAAYGTELFENSMRVIPGRYTTGTIPLFLRFIIQRKEERKSL